MVWRRRLVSLALYANRVPVASLQGRRERIRDVILAVRAEVPIHPGILRMRQNDVAISIDPFQGLLCGKRQACGSSLTGLRPEI